MVCPDVLVRADVVGQRLLTAHRITAQQSSFLVRIAWINLIVFIAITAVVGIIVMGIISCYCGVKIIVDGVCAEQSRRQ